MISHRLLLLAHTTNKECVSSNVELEELSMSLLIRKQVCGACLPVAAAAPACCCCYEAVSCWHSFALLDRRSYNVKRLGHSQPTAYVIYSWSPSDPHREPFTRYTSNIESLVETDTCLYLSNSKRLECAHVSS